MVSIPSINSTLAFAWIDKYSKGLLPKVANSSVNGRKMSAEDAIIFNFGVHYNHVGTKTSYSRERYEDDMKLLVSDVQAMSAVGPSSLPPRFFFLESLPQHFTTMTHLDGYFIESEAANYCVPIGSDNEMAAKDWRNRVAERHLGSLIRRIEVARPLYSQYDAHIAGDSQLGDFDPGDCTHYCAPSGIFQLIHSMILNALLLK